MKRTFTALAAVLALALGQPRLAAAPASANAPDAENKPQGTFTFKKVTPDAIMVQDDEKKIVPAKVGQTYVTGALLTLPEPPPSTGKPIFTSFTVKGAAGDVKIQDEKNKEFIAAVLNQAYPFGTLMKTGRNANTVLELSSENTFRLLANTSLKVLPNSTHPNLVRLRLANGTTKFQLDNYPKNAKFEIQSPVGVCGAVGTGASVGYTITEKGLMNYEVEVYSGMVSFEGEFLKLNSPLNPGESFTLIVDWVKHTVDVRFSGPPGSTLSLELWDRPITLSVPPGTTDPISFSVQFTKFVDIPEVFRPFEPTQGETIIHFNPPPMPDPPRSPAF